MKPPVGLVPAEAELAATKAEPRSPPLYLSSALWAEEKEKESLSRCLSVAVSLGPAGIKPTEAKSKAPKEAELAARASRSAHAGLLELHSALLP